jgi:hypothetical protein
VVHLTATKDVVPWIGRPAQIPFTRRSTLAEKPELDILLAATTITRLPLSAQTIHRLPPYWQGEKLIADTKILERIMMTQEINAIHADHVVAALERIDGLVDFGSPFPALTIGLRATTIQLTQDDVNEHEEIRQHKHRGTRDLRPSGLRRRPKSPRSGLQLSS